METSTKQQNISDRRKTVKYDYDYAVANKASITKTVNKLAERFMVTPITIYADIKYNRENG